MKFLTGIAFLIGSCAFAQTVPSSTWPAAAGCDNKFGCGGDIAPQSLVARYRTHRAHCLAYQIGSTTQPNPSSYCAAYYLPFKALKAGDTVSFASTVQIMRPQDFTSPMTWSGPSFHGSALYFYRTDNSLGLYGVPVSQHNGVDLFVFPPSQNKPNNPYALQHHDGSFTIDRDCGPGECAVILWAYGTSVGNEGRIVNIAEWQGQVSALVFRATP
ncbi:MAG TPA: hypothetical protein VHL79_08650 [Ramlibacter sp.]|nr:hypothetical protein [Ramlibacter sp.]